MAPRRICLDGERDVIDAAGRTAKLFWGNALVNAPVNSKRDNSAESK